MAEINGDAGNNPLGGSTRNDTISGGLGADTLSGGAGDDVLYGFGPADTAPDSGRVDVHQMMIPLDTPVFAVSPPGDPDRLFVVEVTGHVQIIDLATEQKNATAFLDIPSTEIGSGGERGLLGLAFSPDYATSGKFYISMAAPTGEFQVFEYTRSASNPDQADPASKKMILSVSHPENQHYAGWMAFGPDGDLYISTGDGHAGQVSTNPAQDPNALLGKILRIDVRSDDFPGDDTRNYHVPADNPFVGKDGADEVFAMGLRNPWRASFDPAGNLLIGDVGEDNREEVDIIPAGSGGGQNFGWATKEGTLGPTDPKFTDPALEYSHGDGLYNGDSITGGYTYQGPGGAQGLYFMGDFMKPNIWVARFADGKAQSFVNVDDALKYDGSATIGLQTSFGVDGHGRLYATTVDGHLFRLTPTAATGDEGDLLTGGDGNDQVYGGAGSDSLVGGLGVDTLSGGLGVDTLDGGREADKLSGGDGADVFVYRGLPSAAGHVTDFAVNSDKLDLSAVLSAAGYSGSDPVADGYVNFLSVSGGTQVTFDGDGRGAAQSSQLVTTLDGVSGSGFTSAQMLTANSISPPPSAPTIGFGTTAQTNFEGTGSPTTFSFVVNRSGSTAGSSTVNWTVAGSGANPADSGDFAGGTLPSGTLTFAAGETSKTITVSVAGDSTVESDEDFTVTLSGASGATVATATSTATIANDDQPSSSGGKVYNSTGPGATVTGGPGDDTLNASQGPDVLTGGAGRDTFHWSGEPWSPAHVTDFAVGTDRLDLSALFQQAGYTGSDPVADKVIWFLDDGSGGTKVLFDRDGAATGQQWPDYIINLDHVSSSGLTWAQLSGGSAPPASPTIAFTTSSVTHAEGNSGSTAFSYTVTRSGDTSGSSTVNWTVAGSGANPTSGADFSPNLFPSGQLAFAAGETSKTIQVNIAGDATVEADEQFTVTLSGAAGATLGSAVSATGAVTNDDASSPPPSDGKVYNSTGPGATVTGGPGDDTLNASQGPDVLTGGAGRDTFHWSGEPWSPAHVTDFAVGTDRLDLSALFQQAGYTGSDPVADKVIWFLDDGSGGTKVLFDRDGAATGQQWPDYIINLDHVSSSGLTWAQLSGGSAPPPPASPTIAFTTSNVTHAEGNSGSTAFSYTVTRSGDTSGSSSVEWVAVGLNGNPAGGADFVGGVMPSGALTFAAGETTKTVTVTVAGDTTVEADEQFSVNLRNASGAILGPAVAAAGTITNDDQPASSGGKIYNSSGPGATVTAGPGDDTINASQGADVLTGGAGRDTFHWNAEPWAPAHVTDFVVGTDRLDLSALLQAAGYTGSDPVADHYVSFLDDGSGGTKVLFDRDGTGSGQQWPNYIINLDHVAAAGLTWAQLSGGGSPPPPRAPEIDFTSSLVAQPEGQTGTSAFAFTLTRTGDISGASAVDWAVNGSGANPANAADFSGGTLPAGTVAFAAGESTKTIVVGVAGDSTAEQDEGFTVTLSRPSGATLGTATANGLITNDDAATPPPSGGQVYTSSTYGDTLTGGAGNDTLNAGQGPDQLTGNGGGDLFVFHDRVWNAGHITDFAPGTDKIDLRGLLGNYHGTDPVADHWVEFRSDGAGNTQVYVDVDGPSTGDWPYLITTLDHVAPGQVGAADWVFR